MKDVLCHYVKTYGFYKIVYDRLNYRLFSAKNLYDRSKSIQEAKSLLSSELVILSFSFHFGMSKMGEGLYLVGAAMESTFSQDRNDFANSTKWLNSKARCLLSTGKSQKQHQI